MSDDHVYVRTTYHSWIALAGFCLFSLMNAIQWVTLSSISELSMSFFHMSSVQFNMLSMVYMIIYVLGGFFTCTTFQRVGMKKGLIIGNVLNFAGGLLKLTPGIQHPCYTTMIVPQVLSSIAQLFVLSVPPLLAAEYFESKHRGFVTAIASTSNTIGNACALFIPPQIVRNGTRTEFQTLFILVMAVSGAALFTSLLVKEPAHYAYSRVLSRRAPNAGVDDASRNEDAVKDSHDCTKCSVPNKSNMPSVDLQPQANLDQDVVNEPFLNDKTRGCAVDDTVLHESDHAISTTSASCAGESAGTSSSVAVRALPHCADVADSNRSLSFFSSAVQSARVEWQKEVIIFSDVWSAIMKLMSQRDFVFVFVSFSISMGSVWTFVSVLDQILSPFGVSDQVAGLAGGLNILIGCFCAYGVGIFMDRKHLYKYLLLSCLIGTVVCCVSLTLIFWRVEPFTKLMSFLLAFVYTTAGIFQSTAVPVCFEFAMEITYPFPEAIPSTLLMIGANLTSLILLLISTAMLSNDNSASSTSIHVMLLLTSVLAVGTLFSGLPRERLNRFTAIQAARAKMQELDSNIGEIPAQLNEELGKHKENSDV